MNVRGIARRFRRLSPAPGQLAHVLRTRPPREPPESDPVRLACIRHAASVDPEPGSNSPPMLWVSEKTRTPKGPLLRVDGHAMSLLSHKRWLALLCATTHLSTLTTWATRINKRRALRLRHTTRHLIPSPESIQVRCASLSTCSPSSRANIRLRRRRLLLRHHPRPPVPLRGSLFSEPAEPTVPRQPLSR